MNTHPIELKPCPFCGGKGEIQGLYGAFVSCIDCYIEGPYKAFEEEAIEAWNTRADGAA